MPCLLCQQLHKNTAEGSIALKDVIHCRRYLLVLKKKVLLWNISDVVPYEKTLLVLSWSWLVT